MQIPIRVTSDFVCPWCYIGEKRLLRAVEPLSIDLDIQLQWLPFELNPDMPPEGMDRQTYLSRKFGSLERVRTIQDTLVLAGREDGASFNYDALKRTPNTFLAHRVSWLAQREGRQRAFVAATLQAYFADGCDIGSKDVLIEIGGRIGLDRDAVAGFVGSDEGARSVRALERTAVEAGVRGVPYFDIAGTPIVGAQPADTIRRVIIEAAARLSSRPAA